MDKYVYLICDVKYPKEKIISAIKGGCKYVQVRLKNVSEDEYAKYANYYKYYCYKYGAKLIINDNLEVAKKVNADGIHIGQGDQKLLDCMQQFPNKIYGVSVHNEKEAKAAIECGATYLGIGAIFPSNTKKDAKLVNINTLKKIYEISNIDVVSIGGINRANILQVSNWCDGVAICEGVLNTVNPEQEVKDIKNILNALK